MGLTMIMNSKIRAGLLATFFGILTIGLGSWYLVQHTAQKTMDELAADTASHWASHLVDSLPGIRNIADGHAPSWQAREMLERTQTVGDIFRYKMFNSQGVLVLVSDNPYFRLDDNASLLEHNSSAARALQTGEVFVDVHQGNGIDRPLYYSEAYVPIAIDDETIGIIEVYIDQTHARESLVAALGELSILTFLALTAAFCIPAAGSLWLTHLHEKTATQLNHTEHHDGLTGTRTRASFKAEVGRRIASGHDVTVYALGFDHFKAINDTHGLHVGDDVLRQAAKRLKELVGNSGFVGRPGGDEFAICRVNDQQTAENCMQFTEEIRKTLRRPFHVNERTIAGSCSVGFATSPTHGEDPVVLVQRATFALDQSKREGRNRAVCYAAAIERMRKDRLNLEGLVRDAVQNERFSVHYQPQFDTRSAKLTGFEALVRLNDRDGTPISPEKFVPVAEEMGLINHLGSWVLRSACGFAALWPEDLTIAINLSAMQFENGRLVDTVKDILQETRLPTERLELEITESLLIDDTGGVISQLHDLSALGIKIALDDFGTGYSSLSYLWQFPFDRLKIDRSFVQQIESTNGKAFDILHSIVSLAQALNLEITAEGVETLKQVDVLRGMGASHVQGFLLGRPMPEVDVPALILSAANPSIGTDDHVDIANRVSLVS
jgi:diguanylate cyclase (GGDEF)-like protein